MVIYFYSTKTLSCYVGNTVHRLSLSIDVGRGFPKIYFSSKFCKNCTQKFKDARFRDPARKIGCKLWKALLTNLVAKCKVHASSLRNDLACSQSNILVKERVQFVCFL